MVALAVFQMGKEFFEMILLRLRYFKKWVNYLEIILYGSTILFLIPLLNEKLGKWDEAEEVIGDELKWSAASVSILFAWLNLLLYMKRFPFFGLYVVMFVEVLKTLLSVITVFIVFIIAFALSFFVLLDKLEAFKYPGRAILKTGIMMIGEFEYDSIFTDNFSTANKDMIPYKGLAITIFVGFVVVMPIVIMNLLVSLFKNSLSPFVYQMHQYMKI